jgi:hypothetical protein
MVGCVLLCGIVQKNRQKNKLLAHQSDGVLGFFLHCRFSNEQREKSLDGTLRTGFKQARPQEATRALKLETSDLAPNPSSFLPAVS